MAKDGAWMVTDDGSGTVWRVACDGKSKGATRYLARWLTPSLTLPLAGRSGEGDFRFLTISTVDCFSGHHASEIQNWLLDFPDQ